MRGLHMFMNGVTRLNDVIGRWIALLVGVMSLLLLLEVFCRYVLSSPTVWANELTQLLFGFYAAMSGGYIMAHRGHVNVDILYSTLSKRSQAILDVLTSALFFVFMAALVYFGSSMAWESIAAMESSFSAWDAPIWPVKLAIPVGSMLLLLQGIVKLLQDLAVAFNLGPFEVTALPPGAH